MRARVRTRQLMLLVAIGDEGNIHRAAELLDMAQPAASKLLKDLEDALGVELFERLSRGMRATWYGETMIRHARIALSSLRQAGQELDALRTGHFGEVCIGAITGPALTLMPQVATLLSRERPELRMRLLVESSDVLIEHLLHNKIDIMIGRLFQRHDKSNLAYERLTDEPVCAVVRPNHPLLDEHDLKLAKLATASWIVPPTGSALRRRFDLMFQEYSLSQPRQLIETSSILFVTKMLQRGDFIAVIPTDVARYYASYGMVALLPIRLTCSMDAFGIVTRRDWQLSPTAKAVLKVIRAAAVSTYGVKCLAAS